MAEECTETSIATSLGMPTWWPDVHANSLSSWGSNSNTNNSHWQTQNPNSNSSGDEDVSISTSFTNASNQSGLTVESSRRGLVESAPANELIGETDSDNQLWNHVLLGNQEGLPAAMLPSSKGLSSGMFAPSACNDYLKKMESSWEFMPPSSMNNFEKQFNYNNLFESQRLTKLSNLVNDWSIAPPDHFNMARFSQSDMISHMKQKMMDRSSGDPFSCYNNPHDLKVKDEHQSVETLPGTLFGQLLSGGNGMDYQLGLKNSILGDDDNKYYYGMQSAANICPSTSTRSFADVISFNGLLNKPLSDSIQPTPPAYRSTSNLSDCKKPAIQAPSRLTAPTSQTVPRRGQASNSEGKKKRSEEKSGTTLKKAKHESSTTKMQVPKVKLADKVTALQQIVSPFGKTDTASVLGEAIGYIKFLQEQVQLLSNPYMKTNISKDPWGGLDRNDEYDLKSRGLCLVPISCTPQVYRDNTGSDYWTPTYRGCLYR